MRWPWTRKPEQPAREGIPWEAPRLPGYWSMVGSFRQGTPAPAFLPRHRYGTGNTIHQTGTIDVQLDQDGEVCAVWFRCRSLPFTVSRVGGRHEKIQPALAIEEITYVDLREEEAP